MSIIVKSLSGAALATVIAAAVGSFSATGAAAESAMEAAKAKTEAALATGKFEACYGVALKGQNDCASTAASCAGHAIADYQGDAFKLVPIGTCTAMETPKGKGSLTPLPI